MLLHVRWHAREQVTFEVLVTDDPAQGPWKTNEVISFTEVDQ